MIDDETQTEVEGASRDLAWHLWQEKLTEAAAFNGIARLAKDAAGEAARRAKEWEKRSALAFVKAKKVTAEANALYKAEIQRQKAAKKRKRGATPTHAPHTAPRATAPRSEP